MKFQGVFESAVSLVTKMFEKEMLPMQMYLKDFAFLYSAFLGSAACHKKTLGQKFAYLASVQAVFLKILNYALKKINSSIPFGVVK